VAFLDDVMGNKLPTTRHIGDIVGCHELVEPLGNPAHGRPLYWRVRCLKCAAVKSVRTHNISSLRDFDHCKMCPKVNESKSGRD